MFKPITEILPTEHSFVAGYVENDDQRRMAVLLRFFEHQTLDAVAQIVGLPTTTIDDLVKSFAPVYESWRAEQLAAA